MRKNTLWASLAVIVAMTIGLSATFAGEEVTPVKPVDVEKKVADEKAGDCCEGCDKAKADKAAKGEECCGGCDKASKTVATKTETPMCSIMSYVASQIKATKGAEDKCCKGAMKAWFAGGKDVPLAGMRDQLVKDGWTADSTIAFLQKMAEARAAKGDCEGCDKAKGDKTVPTAATGDAADAAGGEGCCGGCDKAKDCSGCDKEKGCEGCPSKKSDEKPAKVDG